MQAQAISLRKLTPEEYLAQERKAEFKSEYFNGEVFAMAGASQKHNLIVANLVSELRVQLKKNRCQVYPSDMRVRVKRTGLYTYPDVTVVCGEPEFDDELEDILLNPTLLIEVLSPSTEPYDRGKKFEHYRRITFLREYLLVAQDRCRVEQYVKQSDGSWSFFEIEGRAASVKLVSVEAVLPMTEIYDKVELEPGEGEA
jgi:Uma2 family endonuclease